MSKCRICNNNIGLFSTKTLCDFCKTNALKKVKGVVSTHDFLNNEYNKKSKKLNYYLGIMEELIKVQEQLELLSIDFPDIISGCETNQSYISKLKENLKERILQQLEIIKEKNSINKDNKELNKDLKKKFEEVTECKINYPIFSDTLSECQNIIKKEIIE